MTPVLALLLAPAVLSALVLGAHFLRRGQLVACALCLGATALVFVRRPWAPRVLQGFLALGVLEWARTLVALLAERRASGEPAGRLVVIIVAVIGVAILGAALLGTRRVLEHARSSAGVGAP